VVNAHGGYIKASASKPKADCTSSAKTTDIKRSIQSEEKVRTFVIIWLALSGDSQLQTPS
jgi:hypothetical protein